MSLVSVLSTRTTTPNNATPVSPEEHTSVAGDNRHALPSDSNPDGDYYNADGDSQYMQRSAGLASPQPVLDHLARNGDLKSTTTTNRERSWISQNSHFSNILAPALFDTIAKTVYWPTIWSTTVELKIQIKPKPNILGRRRFETQKVLCRLLVGVERYSKIEHLYLLRCDVKSSEPSTELPNGWRKLVANAVYHYLYIFKKCSDPFIVSQSTSSTTRQAIASIARKPTSLIARKSTGLTAPPSGSESFRFYETSEHTEYYHQPRFDTRYFSDSEKARAAKLLLYITSSPCKPDQKDATFPRYIAEVTEQKLESFETRFVTAFANLRPEPHWYQSGLWAQMFVAARVHRSQPTGAIEEYANISHLLEYLGGKIKDIKIRTSYKQGTKERLNDQQGDLLESVGIIARALESYEASHSVDPTRDIESECLEPIEKAYVGISLLEKSCQPSNIISRKIHKLLPHNQPPT